MTHLTAEEIVEQMPTIETNDLNHCALYSGLATEIIVLKKRVEELEKKPVDL